MEGAEIYNGRRVKHGRFNEKNCNKLLHPNSKEARNQNLSLEFEFHEKLRDKSLYNNLKDEMNTSKTVLKNSKIGRLLQ